MTAIIADPEPARTEPAYVLPAAPITLTPHTAADLMVGDFLIDTDGVDRLVTELVPATREEALAYGAREARSGIWWHTYDATEPVVATPGRLRMRRIAEQAAAVNL